MTNQSTITDYVTLDSAFDFFNTVLFDGALSPIVLTFQRKKNAYGFFSWDCFVSRDGSGVTTHEVASNPDYFVGRSDKDILATLAHEMAHLWQQEHGNPSRTSYHNKEWAAKMIEIGLQPFNVDHPEKMTGQKVHHEIVAGGKFDVACDEFLGQGHALQWQGVGEGAADNEEKEKKAKKKNKVKYTCPGCGQNAWAKPGAKLVCGECMTAMIGEDAEAGEEEGAEEDN